MFVCRQILSVLARRLELAKRARITMAGHQLPRSVFFLWRKTKQHGSRTTAARCDSSDLNPRLKYRDIGGHSLQTGTAALSFNLGNESATSIMICAADAVINVVDASYIVPGCILWIAFGVVMAVAANVIPVTSPTSSQ